MNWAQEIVKYISGGLQLSPEYSYFYLLYVIFVIGFVVWAVYYVTYRDASGELANIKWLSLKSTIKYSLISLVSIVVSSMVLYGIDTVLNQIFKEIIKQ